MASAYCPRLKYSFPRPKRSMVSCGSCSSSCFSASMRSWLILLHPLTPLYGAWHPACDVPLYATSTLCTSHSLPQLTEQQLIGTFNGGRSGGVICTWGARGTPAHAIIPLLPA